MRIPYSCLATHEDIVFAARGGQVQTFRLEGGPALATWNHPDAEKEASASKQTRTGEDAKPPKRAETESTPANGEPPAKRQRREPTESTPETPAQEAEGDEKKGQQAGGKKRKDKKSHSLVNREPISRLPDRHIIIVLKVSRDGNYVVAVSGHDKTLWVFEHDGKGALKESSKRPLPKRPSDLTISPDEKTIILGDKFGDVYALPLDPSKGALGSDAFSLHVKHERDPSKPAANAHTVHSQINLRSLEMQQRAIERRKEKELLQKQKGQEQPGKESQKEEAEEEEEPAFENVLILGHVSMLTAVALAEHEGRRYILTSDRDEHIRVSRYLPQAYVIEAFCLGHKEFVNCLAVSEAQPDIMVSGGGDDELFVWDWRAGRLFSKADVLSYVRQVNSEAPHVAVSKICSSASDVFAICEGIPAVFQWTLSDTRTLENCRVLRLPGNPLDISPSASKAGRTLVVAVDRSSNQEGEQEPRSLLVYAPSDDGSSWLPRPAPFEESASDETVLDISAEEVERLLYTVDHLRKRAPQHNEDGETEGQGQGGTEQEG